MARVIKETSQPRSYLIESDGVTYRRNRRDLFATKEDPPNYDQDWELSGDENDTNIDTKPQNVQTTGPYKTRSGRVSKAPERYHDKFLKVVQC